MENEATIRLSIFLGLFLLLAVAEGFLPRRERRQSRQNRWITNWGLVVLDTALLRLMALALPLLAVGTAIDAGNRGWGLFNQLGLASWLEVLLAVAILDFLIWGQHVITHKIPILWRLHRVHHADRDMDVTTAIRFHPIEIGLSMLVKIGAVYALGPSALAVILFEILLNGCAMFNHANLNLPVSVDRLVRLILVTPDMHRVHHSKIQREHDSNYGFSVSFWDRLFGTYTDQPEGGHETMTVGLEWQDDAPARLRWSLMLPFRKK